MDIKEITNTMNEEKVRKEAAIALFNALGPKHIATAEAYQRLGDLAFETEAEDWATVSYDYYKKAYEGFSAYYKHSLDVENINFINSYFNACNFNNEEDECEKILDLYFEKVSNYVIENDNDFLEEYSDEAFTYLSLFESFLSYIITTYDPDDTDFVAACDTYTDHFPVFDLYDVLDNLTCTLIVQHFIESGNLGSALALLEYLLYFDCYHTPEEGIAIGKMYFSIIEFIVEVSKEEELTERTIKLAKIGKTFTKKFINKENVSILELNHFFQENLEPPFDFNEDEDD